MLLRADSAFCSAALVAAAPKAGAQVSITVRLDPAVKRAIATNDEDASTTIKYTDAIYDEATRTLGLAGRGRRDPLHRLHLPERV